MTSSISIRFPDGTREFRYPEVPITAGDVLYHDSKRWRVLSVSGDGDGRDMATVELVSDDLIDQLQSEEGALRLDAFE